MWKIDDYPGAMNHGLPTWLCNPITVEASIAGEYFGLSGADYQLNPNISRAMCNVRPTGFDVNDLRRSCSGLTLSKVLLHRAETLAASCCGQSGYFTGNLKP